ncbi:MAG TPA: PQQ-dependent sugar dehydrogenase [Noviherbaspirillum sp.]|nr:PQQ-dependent sugar dehydrogenase [Noviherbaspirillum sp.]
MTGPTRRLAPLALACSLAAAAEARVVPQTLASDLEHPWALAFIGDGRMLVTERPGRLRVIEADGRVGEPVQGLPQIDAGGQGGLLDIVADRRFADNRTVYFCYSEPGEGGNSTALASARLSQDRARLEQVRVLFSQRPKVRGSHHFGCRIVEAADGTLFLTTGDRFNRMDDAQTLDNHLGKVVRVNKDGSVPKDNPFVQRAGALPEIWSYGHRNMQGATLGPDGRLWTHEHGPRGGDELNITQPGRNYGWPLVSHGVHYSGQEVGRGKAGQAGVEAPVHHWTPSIAPSGMAFLDSDAYGQEWRGNLFVGALAGRHLVRLTVADGRVVAEEQLLKDFGRRIRDVRMGPDGLLYLLTDERRGQLVRLRPE